jgi:SM-20-related protein
MNSPIDSLEQMPDGFEAALAVTDDQATLETAGQALAERGWWVGRQAVDAELVAALVRELDELVEDDRLRRAGIGRDLDFQIAGDIRRDLIFWLQRQRPVQAAFLDQMEALRLSLNRELFMGLFEFEAHFALYPPGGFYRRHLDSFRGAANRMISTVTYLNPDWQPGDGGELLIYPELGDEAVARIEPRAGTMVLFLSEEIPHEVLPARVDRRSIAGWFRLNASIGNQIDPPR